jgi:8-oxo-dGTP pyrophosphatase MutT (NUDIX family)
MSAVVQPQRPQIAVSAAIFRDGKVLLTRRARSPAKGFYSLPGGRVEFGESLHQALNREVLPATAGAGHYLIMSFAARWAAREPVLNDELDDYRWIAPDALASLGDLKLTGGLEEVIQSAARLIGH